jgi:hypothetical protein
MRISWKMALAACAVCALLGMASIGVGVVAAPTHQAGSTLAHGASSPKGSSCANPYQVHWDTGEGNRMGGDTAYIHAVQTFDPVAGTFTLKTGPGPLGQGLKPCATRIIIAYFKCVRATPGTRCGSPSRQIKPGIVYDRTIRHHWLPKPTTIRPQGGEWAEKSITVTAARSR